MKPKIQVPENAALTDDLIKEIAELKKKANKIIEAANVRIKAVRDRANREVDVLEDEIREFALVIFEYYRKNKKELTGDGRLRIVKLCEGCFREYFAPRSVRIIGEEQDAIRELIKRGLRKFIRIKKEVDKEAIQRHPGKVEGMKYIKISKRKKKFSVTPNETSLSVVVDISKK